MRLKWAETEFTAKDGRIERMLQKCARNKIILYDVRGAEDGIYAACKASDYRRAARIARQYRTRVRLQKKTGLYFKVRGLKARKALLTGILIAALFMHQAQAWVWSIQFRVPDEKTKVILEQQLRKNGVLPGCRASLEQMKRTEQRILLEMPQLQWVSLNFAGGRLTAEAVSVQPEATGKTIAEGNITAKRAGQVVSVNALAGTQMVKEGQIVQPGEVLIAAEKPDHEGQPVRGAAEGQVLARFEAECSAVVPYRIQGEFLTGDTGSRCIFLTPLGAVPATEEWKSDETALFWQPELFGFCLPVTVCEIISAQTGQGEIDRSPELCLEAARLETRRNLLAEYPDAVILSVREEWEQEENELRYRAQYVCEADIAEQTGESADSIQ